MAEANKETVKKSFVSTPYKGAYKADLDEPDEKPDDSNQNADPADKAATQAADENLLPEEKTYKQRYADLRRREQKLLDEKRQLEQRLTQSASTSIKLPKTKEELEAFKAQQPETYGLIQTISHLTADENVAQLKKKIEELEEVNQRVARDRAEATLLNMHPDFDTIRDTDEFHAWADKQPKNIQEALYNNFDDPVAAARAIDLYKLDTGLLKPNKTKKDKDREAAQAVSPTNRPEPEPPKGKIWKESEIRKLTTKQFTAVEDELDDARREGRIEFDLSR